MRLNERIAPTEGVSYALALAVAAKLFDGATTVAVIRHPELFETVPYTVFLVDLLGVLAGVAVATVTAVVGVVAVAEFGRAFCDRVHDVLDTESPYPCIAQYTAYLFSSVLFAAAGVWNLRLILAS